MLGVCREDGHGGGEVASGAPPSTALGSTQLDPAGLYRILNRGRGQDRLNKGVSEWESRAVETSGLVLGAGGRQSRQGRTPQPPLWGKETEAEGQEWPEAGEVYHGK